MDKIEEEKIVINLLVEIFKEKSFQDDLELTGKTIESKFKNLLVEKGENYGLISKNSVRDLRHFSLVNRIKESDSLKEKFFRANLLQKDFSDYIGKDSTYIKSNRPKIKLKFKDGDDIIGVKILTDLNEDCKKVLSILKENETELIAEGIFLDEKDLISQPSIMKNGLEIYKIKGRFNKDYSFELQIKSKIVSAWGDMEHAIFYKDYFISPVRESTQATMNHIGKLLFQIDDFLVSVREANKSYKVKADVINFLTWFDDNYSEKISAKLGNIGYKIDSFSEALYFIKMSEEIPNTIFKRDLYFKHFLLKPRTSLAKEYVRIRDISYDLKIFESIVFSWLWIPSKIKENNIDNYLNKYLGLIINYLTAGITKEHKGYEEDKTKERLNYYFNELLKFSSSSLLFFSLKNYLKHYLFIDFLRSEIEMQGHEKIEKILHQLDLIFLCKRLDGDCLNLIDSMKMDGSNKVDLKNILEIVGNNILLKGKTKFLNEKTFIDELIIVLSK